jgi:hypothetical protein
MLAGHTHGRPDSAAWHWHRQKKQPRPARRWCYGLVKEREQYLYVTAGIGTSGVPIRWGVPPAVLDLIGTASSSTARQITAGKTRSVQISPSSKNAAQDPVR